MKRLDRDLGQPAPIPQSALDRVRTILQGGQLTRYGEFSGSGSEVAALEREFATYLGARFAVATNSGGSALHIALLAAGVKPGDRVLMNAFTLAPVPGAVVRAGAEPLYVECGEDYVVDLDDLERKACGQGGVFLMSHMRGHIADMDAVLSICEQNGLVLIEDCAHTLGASWDGVKSGRFGAIGCFSLQAYKHINAGEGGILVTDNEDMAAMAILYSGSYMLYAQNGAAPPDDVFQRHYRNVPNLSCRMPEVTAAIARPQIALLDKRSGNWNRSYARLAELLSAVEGIVIPARDSREAFVASSIQFSLPGIDAAAIQEFVDRCTRQGVGIKWFGRSTPQGFTSTWEDWAYVRDVQELPLTRRMLDTLCDMRIPLDLAAEDCELIADIIGDALRQALESARARLAR
jgi:dTDP-4-amino-4,6-dideoxygalactose transaminase